MIISFAGRLGSGKGTLASHLKLHSGYEILTFATYLKRLLSLAYDLDISNFIDRNLKDRKFEIPIIHSYEHHQKICSIAKLNKKSWNKLFVQDKVLYSCRELLQYIGTDLLRTYDQNFHVNKTLESIDPNKNYVCDDLRYPNELAALKKVGAINIFILRPSNFEYSNHISEISLRWRDFDYYLINDETEKDLVDRFNILFEYLTQAKINTQYSIQKYDLTDIAFYTATSNWAYFVGFFVAGGKFEKKINYIEFASEIQYVVDDLKNVTDTKQEIINNDNKFFLRITSPFIIENLKYWNISLDNNEVYVPPDIIRYDTSMLKEWIRGLVDGANLIRCNNNSGLKIQISSDEEVIKTIKSLFGDFDCMIEDSRKLISFLIPSNK